MSGNFRRERSHAVERATDQPSDAFAVIIAVQKRRDAPVGDCDILSHDVAEARRFQFGRRLGENTRVGDDNTRLTARIGNLKIIVRNGRAVRSKAVHRRRGGENRELLVFPIGRKTADIVDRAGADR